jgi:hypothetical protein
MELMGMTRRHAVEGGDGLLELRSFIMIYMDSGRIPVDEVNHNFIGLDKHLDSITIPVAIKYESVMR